MIHIITSFKYFSDKDRAAQRGALYSWSLEGLKIITSINESTTKEGCQGYDAQFVDGVRTARDFKFSCNAVVLKDLIIKALDKVDEDPVILLNGDIIITPGFRNTLGKLWKKYGPDAFFSGTRFGIDLESEITNHEEYEKVLNLPRKSYNDVNSADIFITSRAIFSHMANDMPNLIMGRYGWDNWIHFWVEVNIKNKYNCTEVLPILHCEHDHSHIEAQEGKPGRKAPSSVSNLTNLMNMQKLYGQSTVRINHWTKAGV